MEEERGGTARGGGGEAGVKMVAAKAGGQGGVAAVMLAGTGVERAVEWSSRTRHLRSQLLGRRMTVSR